jgi:aryl-alcohol dehydrogenase-like predicted oxidoreductase
MGDLLRDEVLERVGQYARLAAEAGLSPADLALAWVLRTPGISAAIMGATRPEQVIENAKAVEIRLDDDLVRAVEEILDPVVTRDPSLTRSPATRW